MLPKLSAWHFITLPPLIASRVFACEGEDVLLVHSREENDVAVGCLFWWLLPRWCITICNQLFSLRLPQMTKYCIMRECCNIHSWISLSGDLAFSHQDGIYCFKSPKRVLEISSRDLTFFTLLLIKRPDYQPNLWNWCPFPMHSHDSMPGTQSDILTSATLNSHHALHQQHLSLSMLDNVVRMPLDHRTLFQLLIVAVSNDSMYL